MIFFFLLVFSATTLFPTEPNLELTLQNQQIIVKQIVDRQDELDLVDIEEINPNIMLDIRYATEDNVLEKVLYSSSKCYFREHVALALDAIQKELEPMGLGLKIFDGYRPWQVQVEGYEKFPDLFAKPTDERAKHPRGTAVDLTLVDKDGNEILMPTGFDDTTEKASRACRKGILKEARENREVLEQVMVKHGFVPMPHEWWHFDHHTWKACPVIKLTFEEIENNLG